MYLHTNFPSGSAEEALAIAIDAIGRSEFVPATLDYLRLAAPFHGCLALIFEDGKRPVHVYDNVRAERRSVVIDRYLDGAYLLDPFREYFQNSRGDAVARIREVAPDRFRNSTYFRSYYSHIRLKDEAGLFVALANGKTLFFSIAPLDPEREFAPSDIKALRRVLPVLAALCRRHFDRFEPTEAGTLEVNIEEVLSQGPGACLSPRESQIAALILKGHSTEAIARLIGISGGTVKLHRKNIYRKLEISSQGELFNLLLSEIVRA